MWLPKGSTKTVSRARFATALARYARIAPRFTVFERAGKHGAACPRKDIAMQLQDKIAVIPISPT